MIGETIHDDTGKGGLEEFDWRDQRYLLKTVKIDGY